MTAFMKAKLNLIRIVLYILQKIKGGGGSDIFKPKLKVKGTQPNKELQL